MEALLGLAAQAFARFGRAGRIARRAAPVDAGSSSRAGPGVPWRLGTRPKWQLPPAAVALMASCLGPRPRLSRAGHRWPSWQVFQLGCLPRCVLLSSIRLDVTASALLAPGSGLHPSGGRAATAEGGGEGLGATAGGYAERVIQQQVAKRHMRGCHYPWLGCELASKCSPMGHGALDTGLHGYQRLGRWRQ